MKLIKLFILIFLLNNLNAISNGEKVFKEYCWGCHHQSAEAFGPSFKSIANKRKKDEIIAQIVSPQITYKLLGYKRNSMPSFSDLTPKQIDDIVKYIEQFKDKK